MNLIVAFITGLTTGGLGCLAVQSGLLATTLAYQVELDMQERTNTSGKFKPHIAQPILLIPGCQIDRIHHPWSPAWNDRFSPPTDTSNECNPISYDWCFYAWQWATYVECASHISILRYRTAKISYPLYPEKIEK